MNKGNIIKADEIEDALEIEKNYQIIAKSLMEMKQNDKGIVEEVVKDKGFEVVQIIDRRSLKDIVY